MRTYYRIPSQYGFAPIAVPILLVIIIGVSLFLIKNIHFEESNQITPIKEATNSATIATPTNSKDLKPTPSAKITLNPTKTSSLISKTPNKVSPPSPTTILTPKTKTITVSGFAYEDRTNNGLFDSDDPKLPNMQLLIYDSVDNEWINSIYSGQDGGFTVTNTVKGDLLIKPGCNENFCPKDASRTFSASSSNQQFAFRSASAPTGSNNGVIEGDLIIDGNRSYKFYLLDKNNNYYSNIEWAGGHFKAQNLPNNQTYIIRISYGDSSPDDTEITLTPSSPENKIVQVHVQK